MTLNVIHRLRVGRGDGSGRRDGIRSLIILKRLDAFVREPNDADGLLVVTQ
jgi:hypothetical protein